MQLGQTESVYVRKEKVTRQQRFLLEMDQVVQWAELERCVTPYYDKTGVKGGRPPGSARHHAADSFFAAMVQSV